MKKLLMMVVLVLCFNTIQVSADTVTFDNDGKERENPYGDSKLKKSFNADYYDCYVPYNLTALDIGGWSQGSSNAISSVYKSPMSENAKKRKISAYVNYEGDKYSRYFGSATKGYDAETGMTTYTDANGTVYYVTAIQHFFYNNSSAGQNGFPGFSIVNRGQIFDIILTDGTCIHFVVGDANAIQHTNAGADDNEGGFDVTYNFTDLLIPQYKHLFQAQAGNCLEVWGKSGAASGFSRKYNFGSGEGENRIAYYRMYNAFIKNNPERMDGVPSDVSYSYGNVSIDGSSSSNSNGQSADSTGKTILAEWDLVGMGKFKNSMSDGQKKVELATKDQLSIGQQYSVTAIGSDLEMQQKAFKIDNVRVAVVFIGMCMIFYGILLGICTLFDKVNNFIDISLVKIITFGLLTYSEESSVKGKKGYANSGRIVFVISTLLIIGCLLVSGGVLPFMMDVINYFVDMFTYNK